MSLPGIAALFLLGSVTGILSGYLGIGGGIILVPVLTEIFRRQGIPLDNAMTAAFATSLTTAIFTTGSSAWQQWRQKNLILAAVPWAAAGAIFGGQSGAWLGSSLDGSTLKLLFGVFLLLAAGYMLIEPKANSTNEQVTLKHRFMLVIAGFGTGILAGLFGVGGGVLMVPLFIFLFHYPPGKVAGTSSAVAFPIALSAVLGYLLYGSARAWHGTSFVGVIDLGFAIPVSAGTLLSAPFGAKLNRRLGGKTFKKVFAFFLMAVALRMILV
ncbi:sulfite exporter TauE/SafE family protein [Calditrichota bacterium]